jgi:hypothetical protein
MRYVRKNFDEKFWIDRIYLQYTWSNLDKMINISFISNSNELHLKKNDLSMRLN